MKSNEDRPYIKTIEFDTIYYFVVDNYFIRDHLEAH